MYKGIDAGTSYNYKIIYLFCERLLLALLCRCVFLSVAYTEERRVGIIELLSGDIAFALCLNIAYSFFDARSEFQPPVSGSAIS